MSSSSINYKHNRSCSVELKKVGAGDLREGDGGG